MSARARSSLLLGLLAGACAAPPVAAPSLATRTAEAIDPRVPVASSAPIVPADAALVARLAELVGRARQGNAAFLAAAAEAERLASAAGAPQTESWVVAQQALSVAVAARAPVTRALGDIDDIGSDGLAERGGIAPANRAAIEAAAADVAAIDQGQAARIDRLQARLGG